MAHSRQTPSTMPREGPRQDRRAPEPSPSVDIWLDSVPPSTTKPSPEEQRQWDLDNRGNSGKLFFLTRVGPRVISLIAALVVVVLSLTKIASIGYQETELVPSLVVCLSISAWDVSEFVTMFLRGGAGFPQLALVAVDGVIVAATAIASGFSFAAVSWRIKFGKLGWSYYLPVDKDIACLALSILLILLHSFLAIFLWCTRVRGRAEKQKMMPRIMYLPTGIPVVVTQKPVVPSAVAPLPASSMASHDPRTDASIQEAFRQGVPPRKPVASAPVGTRYAAPWPGPDYEPGEAERARAIRGERQAQWMTVQK